MIIDLITLKESPYHFAVSLAPNEIDLDNETAKVKDSVQVEGKVAKHIARTEVEGEIAAKVEIECSRCLQPAERDLKIPFKTEFVTEENYTAAKESEITGNDLDVSIFDGAHIDLNELAREQILLNLPEQVFCREDCKGFCEKCRANRNLIDCKCEDEKIDPRWQGLRELKIKK